jgi:hypothetical protein
MEWLSLLEKDPTALLDQLENKERDPLPAMRKQIAGKLERSRMAYEQGRNRGPVYKRVGDFCRVELKAGVKPTCTIPVAGNAFNMIPAEHFSEFVTGFKGHVEAGAFDSEIRAALADAPTKSTGKGKQRKRRPRHADNAKARSEKRGVTLAD